MRPGEVRHFEDGAATDALLEDWMDDLSILREEGFEKYTGAMGVVGEVSPPAPPVETGFDVTPEATLEDVPEVDGAKPKSRSHHKAK